MESFVELGRSTDVRAARGGLDDFRTSGLALVTYVTHRIDPRAVEHALANGLLREVDGPTSYASKLTTDNPLKYCVGEEFPASSKATLVIPGMRASEPLRQNVIWIQDSPVLVCAVPVKVQVPHLATASGARLRVSANYVPAAALGIREVIDLVSAVTSPGLSGHVADLSARVLSERLGGAVVDESRFVDGIVGIDIWSLSGSRQRDLAREFDAARDCVELAWPISAILNHSSDHVVNHFYDELSDDEIRMRLQSGFNFMRDHAIFLDASCALELTHFDDWVPQRSWDRLRDYGFDSSTMFLLGVALARRETIKVIGQVARAAMMDMTGPAVTRVLEDEAHETALRLLDLLDVCGSLNLAMREQRSRTVDAAFQEVFGDTVLEASARGRLDATRELAVDRRSRREQDESQWAVTRLALAAAVLAVAAMPSALDVVWAWVAGREFVKLVLGAVIMVLALGVITRVAKPSSGRTVRPRWWPGARWR